MNEQEQIHELKEANRRMFDLLAQVAEYAMVERPISRQLEDDINSELDYYETNKAAQS